MPDRVSPVPTDDHGLFNSLIGEGTLFKGDVNVNGILRIDGDFIGSINTKGKVFIGRSGRAECTIHASSIVIGGVVRGKIVSTEKVVILSSAVVIGQIQAPRLIAEEGVLLEGEVRVSGGGKVSNPATEKRDGSFFNKWIRGKAVKTEESVGVPSPPG